MSRAILLLLIAGALSAQTATTWKLVWSDEFNQTAGSPPDPAKWNYDLGTGSNGWGNNELESYTNSPQNVFQDGKGNLVIRAIRDASGKYTSARLQTGSPGASTHTTDGNWQYGRIVARIKLPYGQGVWPAFWMLGENIGTAGWPTCGEIDIMENFGVRQNNANANTGTAHGPGYSGGNGITKRYTLPLGQKVADDYHVYSIEWSQDSIEWFVDGVSYHKATPESVAGKQWVFNAPFFILLNLAIGGNPVGSPDGTTVFPQDMLVDYVRVYQAAPAAAAAPAITPGSVVNAASYLGTLAPGSVAALYGANLADSERVASGAKFPTALGDTTVSVNGAPAPLLYASPSQIDFQVPWETAPSLAAVVKVMRGGVESEVETVTISSGAPSLFLNDGTTGAVWVTGSGCATTECAVQAGGAYQLWGNGFGPKNGPSETGGPAVYAGSLGPLQVPGACELTIGGQAAPVQYCGAAPGLIIDQLNFVYPSGVASDAPLVAAALTIGGVTGHFLVPAPR